MTTERLSELELAEIQLTLDRSTQGDWMWQGRRSKNERELELVSRQNPEDVVLAVDLAIGGEPLLLVGDRAGFVSGTDPGLCSANEYCEYESGKFADERALVLVQHADLKLIAECKRWVSLLLAECKAGR